MFGLDESLQEWNGDLTHGAKNVLLQEGLCCISVVAFNTTLSALDYVLISKLEVNQFKLKTKDCQPSSGELDLCVFLSTRTFRWREVTSAATASDVWNTCVL